MSKEAKDKDKGWVKLHRNLQDHWIWSSELEPFDMRSAWLDLLMMMNFEDRKFKMGQELVFVERGQRITSLRKLGERWNWSNTKVRNFLKLLESDGMIVMEKDTKKTVVTLCNYNKYQALEPPSKNTGETGEIHAKDTGETDEIHAKDTGETGREHGENTSNTREHTNKKEKNYKNEKNDKNGKNEKESVVVGVIGPAGNFVEICQKYMEIFGSPLTATYQQALQGYLDKGLTEELIILAIEEAGFQDKRTFSYLRGILNNWYNDGIKTVDQAKKMMAEHEKKKNSNKNKGKGRDKYDDKESSGLTEGEEELYRKLFG